jgi:hypothetical protein
VRFLWKIYYLFIPTPTLEDYCTKLIRTTKRHDFKSPLADYNYNAGFLQVFISGEDYYCKTENVRIEVYRSQSNNKITGYGIYVDARRNNQ